jgi:hypothetical protein
VVVGLELQQDMVVVGSELQQDMVVVGLELQQDMVVQLREQLKCAARFKVRI